MKEKGKEKKAVIVLQRSHEDTICTVFMNFIFECDERLFQKEEAIKKKNLLKCIWDIAECCEIK